MKHYEFVGINLPKELIEKIDKTWKDKTTPFAHRTALIDYGVRYFLDIYEKGPIMIVKKEGK